MPLQAVWNAEVPLSPTLLTLTAYPSPKVTNDKPSILGEERLTAYMWERDFEEILDMNHISCRKGLILRQGVFDTRHPTPDIAN